VAEALAICAAFFFALAATLQQKGALGMGEVSLGSPSSFVQLAKQTFWLLGTIALLVGYALQAAALDRGRLAVIQPLLVLIVVFALPLGYFLTSQHVGRTEVGGACLVVLGLAFFTVVGEAAEGRDNAPANEWAIVTVFVAIAAVVLVVLGGRGSVGRKASLYGAAAGILFGLSASLCKPTVEIFHDDGLASVFSSWEFYAFALSGIVAFVVQQVSLATGRLAASVATVSVFNPLVSIVIGTLLLQERLADPTWHKVVAYGGLGLALFGAVTIAGAAVVGTEADSSDADQSPIPAPAT
jgi:drug/metabolite transporter (DMT)-like permease